MDQAAEKIGGDFFVLPSSIHEVLLIPDDGTQDYHDLAEMVQTINETQVAPAERLSDNVYHYDKADRVFELADKTTSRNLSQEMEKKAAARDGAEKKPSVLEQLGEKRKRRWIMHRKQKHREGLHWKQPYNFTGAYWNKGALEAYYKKRISLPFLMHQRGRIT